MGRRDQQVKINGNRIELGEIAAVLNEIDTVRGAVAIINEHQGSKWITAYYSAEEEIDEKELRKRLAHSLPYYMMPRYIMYLNTLPLTLNGKIDVASLPAPDIARIERAQEEHATDTMNYIRTVWSELLGMEEISLNDNFMAIGGNSIMLIKMQDRLNARYHETITIADIFAHPTIVSMAEYIESKQITEDSIILNKQKLRQDIVEQPNSLRYNVVSYSESENLSQQLYKLKIENRKLLETILISAYCVSLSEVLEESNEIEIIVASGDEYTKFNVETKLLRDFSDLTGAVSKKYSNGLRLETHTPYKTEDADGVLPMFEMDSIQQTGISELANLSVRCSIRDEAFRINISSNIINKHVLEKMIKTLIAILFMVFGIDSDSSQ
jgi:aryl carrier-like protein